MLIKPLVILVLIAVYSCQTRLQNEPLEVNSPVDTIYVYKDREDLPWDLDCDNHAYDALEEKQCSLTCCEIADSVLTAKYNKIVRAYQNEIANSTDDNSYRTHREEQLAMFTELHSKFLELRILLDEIITMEKEQDPLYRNSYALRSLEDQIKLYDLFEEEHVVLVE